MAGGGTGGHIIPALAVGEELRRRGHHVFFIGNREGMEGRLVPAAGFELENVSSSALNRVGLAQKLRTSAQLPISVASVWSLLRKRRPDAMFSMGGYVAGPAVLAAVLRRLPLVVMEPNALPGMTNRRIARWTSHALVSFPETVYYFPAGRAEVSGVPVRQAFFQIAPKSPGRPFTILLTGGSQGSRTLNEAGRGAWTRFAAAGIRVLHQAGRFQYEQYRDAFAASGVSGELLPFVQDMPAAFAEADLIVCRSGASTVAELAAAGRPAILIPFPFAADNHQQRNAEAMSRAGAAHMILDSAFTADRLYQEVIALASNPVDLERMSENARAMGKPLAAQRAADILEQAKVR